MLSRNQVREPTSPGVAHTGLQCPDARDSTKVRRHVGTYDPDTDPHRRIVLHHRAYAVRGRNARLGGEQPVSRIPEKTRGVPRIW